MTVTSNNESSTTFPYDAFFVRAHELGRGQSTSDHLTKPKNRLVEAWKGRTVEHFLIEGEDGSLSATQQVERKRQPTQKSGLSLAAYTAVLIVPSVVGGGLGLLSKSLS